MRIKELLLLTIGATLAGSCFTINYSFKGADIPPEITTVSVQYFNNRATRIEPTLSQNFTDALKEYIESNTKLRIVNTIGDVDFSGEIKDYQISPAAITSGDVAAKTRFTISVRVKYTNSVNPDENYDTEFSRYREFDSTEDFSSVEAGLTEEIIEEIIEQIFNKTFVNW
ncbi:MAG: LptE family protein [Bacteroidales bacterium]|nr:LptE family protein [Bacteroidales bacterium]